MRMTSSQEKTSLTDFFCNDPQQVFKGLHGIDLITVGDFNDKIVRKAFRIFSCRTSSQRTQTLQ